MRAVCYGVCSGLLLATCAASWADTYTVTITLDSGAGSLRWAIDQANSHAGADSIAFRPALNGSTIRPLTALPGLWTSETSIDGDLDNNGDPDICLNGVKLSTGSGVYVKGHSCTIQGLAIINFPDEGILADGVGGMRIQSCHLGVSLDGTTRVPNGGTDVTIYNGTSHTIGGENKRCVFSGGEGTPGGYTSLRLQDCEYCKIENCTFGLNAAGDTSLQGKGTAIDLERASYDCVGNTVRGCVFAGVATGIHMYEANHNSIWGNQFGLAADGTTALPITECGVRVAAGESNEIGGTWMGKRNIFVVGSSGVGVEFLGPPAKDNLVQGNFFGTNAWGAARRPCGTAIRLASGAGPQQIGGLSPSAGNYICPKSTLTPCGIDVNGGGSGTLIRRNYFGTLPGASANAPITGPHISVVDANVALRDNYIVAGGYGVYATTNTGSTRVNAYENHFLDCTYAVYVGGTAEARLGNLGNVSTDDDGGNHFEASNTWFVYNQTPNHTDAEGNDFDTTVKAQIEAKIYDKKDDASYGRVDFIPLQFGVIPTGEAGVAALAVSGAAAVPTARGAEILFSLSAPADVTVEVLNVAGRPVATLVSDRPTAAGRQGLVWSGRTATGTAAPSGAYLVRITARTAAGGQATALAPLPLSR